VDRYGSEKAAVSPPIRQMLQAGIPLGAGTDATRVASYNPWACLYWLVTGCTIGGLRLYDDRNRLDRTQALRLWTEGSAWFSTEDRRKGRIASGQFADIAVLSEDYFAVDDDAIKDLTAVLTIVGGRIVHGDGPFRALAPPLPPVSPGWSPVAVYAENRRPSRRDNALRPARHLLRSNHRCATHLHDGAHTLWGMSGCACFAF
jgi:hypothetical protein